MEDKLRLNTQLFGFDGIIGRRDYFLNLVYICMINLLIAIPLTNWVLRNSENFFDTFNISKIFIDAPLLLKFWVFIGTIGVCTLLISNIFRRINDISGRVNRELQVVYTVFFILNAFYMFLPTIIVYIVGFITFIFSMILLFKSGKITSTYPHDFRKIFNWGAFLGTWIWGLFNKSYLTLWQLILGLTPWGFYYSLLCGLKGNEWAFKNKNYNNVEAFNRSQKRQTIVFTVLTFIIVPLIYGLIMAGIAAAIAFTTINEGKFNPNSTSKIEQFEKGTETFIDNVSSTYFENYEITEAENKFYVKNSDWKSYTFSDKKDVIDMAATTSAIKRKETQKQKRFSKASELTRTKIYSQETGQLLGEFYLNEESISSNTSAIEIMKSAMNAYKFYRIK